MMRVEKIADHPDRSQRFYVTFSDGTTMRLYRQSIEDFGLYAGLEMTDDAYNNLRLSAGKISAKMRAVRIVSASSVSKADLQRRLVQKGEDPLQAKEAVAWMSELNLLDDAQTAAQIVSRCASKGYGIERAKQALYEKRIPKAYWDAALADYPDQSEHIRVFLLSKLSDDRDPASVRKAVDSLIRKGHHYSDVRNVLNDISVDAPDAGE